MKPHDRVSNPIDFPAFIAEMPLNRVSDFHPNMRGERSQPSHGAWARTISCRILARRQPELMAQKRRRRSG